MRPTLVYALIVGTSCVAAPRIAAAQASQPKQPAVYLDQANQILTTVPNKVKENADKPLDGLRKHFADLNKEYREQMHTVNPPITRQDPDKDLVTWRDAFADVERDLTVLIGGGASLAPSTPGNVAAGQNAAEAGVTPAPSTAVLSSPTAGTPTTSTSGAPSTPATSAMPSTPTTSTATTNPPTANPSTPGSPSPGGQSVPAPVGTTGTSPVEPSNAVVAPAAGDTLAMANGLAAKKVSVTGLKDLDPSVRAQLEQFRLQIELFYSATGNLQ